MKSSKDHSFVRTVGQWFRQHGRKLPWRHERDPYRVLVSEIMLQQTQVNRVLEKYPVFLKRFPSFKTLASASRAEVVRAWQGMGYNNRAVRLHEMAQTIVKHHQSALPQTLEELLALPGIGRYTAHALLSSVHGKPVPVVDINVQRFLSRVFWRMESTADLVDQSAIWDLAGELLPKRTAYVWNQALMDLGATICKARQPQCGGCPVRALCSSQASMRRGIARPTASESVVEGLPNRIYRGRVVEHLRQSTSARGVLFDRVGRSIRPGYSSAHRAWLLRLVSDLQKDGLVRIIGNSSWSSRRLLLA